MPIFYSEFHCLIQRRIRIFPIPIRRKRETESLICQCMQQVFDHFDNLAVALALVFLPNVVNMIVCELTGVITKPVSNLWIFKWLTTIKVRATIANSLIDISIFELETQCLPTRSVDLIRIPPHTRKCVRNFCDNFVRYTVQHKQSDSVHVHMPIERSIFIIVVYNTKFSHRPIRVGWIT